MVSECHGFRSLSSDIASVLHWMFLYLVGLCYYHLVLALHDFTLSFYDMQVVSHYSVSNVTLANLSWITIFQVAVSVEPQLDMLMLVVSLYYFPAFRMRSQNCFLSILPVNQQLHCYQIA